MEVSSPASRPTPPGWPTASLDTGCGHHPHRSCPGGSSKQLHQQHPYNQSPHGIRGGPRLQTATCCGSGDATVVSDVETAQVMRQVGTGKASASDSLLTCRK